MKTHITRVWALSILTSLAALAAAQAADRTWNGAGGNDFWSTPANWGGSAVSANDSLFFGGSVRTSPNNDFPAGTTFNGVKFLNPAGAFTLRGNGITLAGDLGDDQPLVPQIIQFPITLSLSPTVNVAADGSLTLSGIVSGGGSGLTKTGAGQLTLGGANTFGGQIQILGGTLAGGTDGNLGAAPGSATPGRIVIDSGALRATATFTLNANRGIALGPSGGAINVNSGATLSYGGIIANSSGTGGLTKGAFGGLTLSGANTYIGPTVIENGTLTLDFAAASAPVNNVISSASALTLGGGTAGLGAASFDALTMNGKANTANSQTFNGTTITIGPAIIRANSASGGSANITLGALTDQAGGILVVVPPTQNGGSGAIKTTTANTHGILGGWATIGNGTAYRNITMGTEWATVDGSGNIITYTGYTVYGTGQNLHSTATADTNLRINSTATGDVTVDTPDAGTLTDVNTINLSETRAFMINVGNGNTLRLGRYGSIFKSDFANNITWVLGSGGAGGGANGIQDSGTLTAGGAPDTDGDIVFYMNNNASQSQGSLNVECKITDNGSGRVTVVKAGPGSMKLRGHNSFSGGLYLLQGRLQLAGGEIGTANPDGAGTGPITVYPGAYLFPSGTGSVITNECFISGLGTDQEQVGAIRFGNGWSISGNVTLRGDTRLGGGSAGTVATTGISGKISGGFNLDIGALGTITSQMTFWNTNNDWTGNTMISARAGNAAANAFRNGASEVIPHGPGKGNVTINGNTAGSGPIAWDLNGFNETINGLFASGDLSGCSIVNNLAATTSTLTVGDYDQTATYGGTILNGASGGIMALTKIGGGKQTLTGVNTYTGVTTVNGGTLALSGAGSIASSSTINVNGGNLDVSELAAGFTYGSAININNGALTIRSTASPGINTLNLADARIRVASLGATPIVAETTTLTTGGAANYVDIGNVGAVNSYPATFTIVKYGGAIGGTGFNFQLGNVPTPSTVGYVTNNEANTSVDLVLLDGPKPLTWVGAVPAWDINNTINWRAFGITPSVYLDVDSVIFNDTGASGTVDLTTTLQPGAVTVSNDTRTYTFTGAGKISGPTTLTKDGPGTLILANSGTNEFFGALAVNAGTVQVGNGGAVGNLSAGSVVNNGRLLFNHGDDITVANPIAGGIGGLLEQAGPGILTLAGDNSFTGAVLVAQSTLKPGRGNAFGTSDGITTVSPGATLDVNGQNITSEPVTVSGGGVGGNGAIVNSGADQISALRNVTLANDVVFGGANRWDIRNTGGSASLSSGSNPFKITKVGPNAISLVNVTVDAAIGDVDVTQGTFRLQDGTTGLGDIFNTLTVFNGATLAFFNLTPNPLNKIIVLQNGATVAHESARSLVSGSFTLQGTNTFNISNSGTNSALVASGPTDGDGTLVKVGSGPLVLSSASVSHTGPTRVNAGSLLVDGTVVNSPITVSSGTLGGAGTVLSPVLIATNGRLAPGNLTTSNAVMIFENELTLNGTTVMDVNKTSGAFSGDRLQGFGTFTYGGTLQLNLSGEALVAGDEIVLFSFGNASGSFASIVPAAPAAGLLWDTSRLTVDGTVKVVAPARGEFGSVTVVGSDVVFNGSGGPASAEYRVLSSTNVALPIPNWEPVATNSFDASGNFNFSLPINYTTPQRFFILSH